MRKNISNLLQRGNLTPKERYILLIQNNVAEGKTGKRILTEGDEQALESWQAKTPAEAREWNRYNEGWKLGGRMGIEAEYVYWQTVAEHYRHNIISTELAIYPFYRERRDAITALRHIKPVDINEAVEITKKQREAKLKNGLEVKRAVHDLAFESLSDDLRKDILTLDPDTETAPDYLDDEEAIAELLNGKDRLDKKGIEKYAELVAERGYNKHAKEYQLYHSFGELPLLDVAKKWARDNGIKPSNEDYEWLEKIRSGLERKGLSRKEFDEKLQEDGDKEDDWLLGEKVQGLMEQYAKDHQTTVKKLIRETVIKWFSEGLPYEPIVVSESKEAYGGETKHPHNITFKEWLKAKDKARKTLQKHIDKGELTTDKTGQAITGESLYNFKGEYKFVKEFRERVDNYTANLGIVYADDDPEQKGEHLDKELLITSTDKDGKPSFISLFGRALDAIEREFKATKFFKETEKDGETYLEFKHDTTEKAFKDTRQSLIDGYAKLLAFQEIFKRLSKTYQADLWFFSNGRMEQVSEFIDQHNATLEWALTDVYGLVDNKPLNTKEDLYIDREGIEPDAKIKAEYEKQFENILGDDFYL